MVDNQCGRAVDGVSRRTFIAATGSLGAVALAGCAESETSEGVSGTLRISGSSTVYPVSEAAGKEFARQNEEFDYELSNDGSTNGFENSFLPGDSDINGSSRPILEGELESAEDTGFQPVEFQCAGDALTAVVNTENDWLDCAELDQLGEIWHPDSAPETWADIDSTWPDEEIELFGPATTSGTFDYWTEEVIGDFRTIREDFTGTEEDDEIAQGVQGNEFAHGYLPYAYYDNNPDEVKALSIDAGDGCTEPSLEAASEGSYPLARPIYWYVNQEKLQDDEALQGFMEYAIEMSGDQSIVSDDIGYVAMNDQEVEDNLDRLQAAIDGELGDGEAIPSMN
ncbi:substrate-binding domain-containing protein [Natrialba sp. PRR66]|uniref:substrate-binding domain-containing protein n=1 Tax=Natrialba sp. PRR66 TaxID=3098146 RepID=UPI002B1E796E|nr:substrate-binding domain-containing protein [Natrialba sp. PRR66]